MHGQRLISFPSPNSFSMKRYGVYVLPHTKLRYFGEVHKICNSVQFSINFHFFILIFYTSYLWARRRHYQLHRLICFFFLSLVTKTIFRAFSEICLVHENTQQNEMACSWRSLRKTIMKHVRVNFSAQNSKQTD